MTELNRKQIIDRLNAEFIGEMRKLVFWYDDKAEFVEDIESMELENAKIYYLEPDNQFYTKYFLERVDTETNYLIYAPFPKPEVKNNHLEDIMLYSKRFFADRASLLCADLGIEEKYKPIIEKHIKFFANKDRTQRFYDLEIENFNEENILVGLLSVLCKTRSCSFEEVLRIVILEKHIEENKYLIELEKYELLETFWRFCEQKFGYADAKPTLERLIQTLFVTYTDRYLQGEVPKAWRNLISMNQGNIVTFLDNLMNNILYREDYERLSIDVACRLNVVENLAKYDPDEIVHCDAFPYFDETILRWMVDRLISEDFGATLDEMGFCQLCDMRSKMHFGEKYKDAYAMLKNAYVIVKAANYNSNVDMKTIVEKYLQEDCMIDFSYRKFYYYYDRMKEIGVYEQLQTLVEHIYTNEYLNNLLPRWNQAFMGEEGFSILPLQRNFYNRFVSQTKERTIVLASDAMRYEIGWELCQRLKEDPRCTVKLSAMMGVLPSYTRLGMAALLPHKSLVMKDDYEVYADDVLCNDLAGRQMVLQKHCKDSVCVQFDDIKKLKIAALRELFTGKQVIYIYHNQIDARGDKANTEDEVFHACEDAICEVMELIHRISTNANTYRFLVTADHGFLYKRDKLDESDKIGGVNSKGKSIKPWINRRFIISKEAIKDNGVENISLEAVLGYEEDKVVTFPVSSNVFKVAGGGQNYVHGGSSPQEMIVPLLDVKMERGHIEKTPVRISLVSIIQKITNLVMSLDFIQVEPVSDTAKEITYRMVFLSEEGERISNENIYLANSRELDSVRRMFRVRFHFKNQKYDRSKQYYLVVTDDKTGIEQFRYPVIVDITSAENI